jgi:hypothetical protein
MRGRGVILSQGWGKTASSGDKLKSVPFDSTRPFCPPVMLPAQMLRVSFYPRHRVDGLPFVGGSNVGASQRLFSGPVNNLPVIIKKQEVNVQLTL